MYSLFDEDDQDSWERRRQEIEQLGSLLPPDGGAPQGLDLPIPPPYSAYQAPPSVQLPPLEAESGPDWTDALNVGLVGLGGLVDLAANKGKNFGAIAASGAQYGAARAGQRVEQEKDRLAYEERRAQLARQNSYNDLAYQQLLYRQQHDQEQGLRADRRQGTADRNAATKERNAALAETNQDPSELIAWAAKRGYDLSGLETMGQARAALGPLVKEWELEHAGEKAAASELGKTQAELATAGDTTRVAADRARAIGEATLPTELEKVKAGVGARYEAEAPERESKQAREYAKDSEEYRKIGMPATAVLQTLEKYKGRDVPGVGTLDSLAPDRLLSEEGLKLRQNARRAGEMVLRSNTGAAAPMTEQQLNQISTGISPGATEAQLRIAMQLVEEFARSNAAALAVGREGAAGRVNQASGLPGWNPMPPGNPGEAPPSALPGNLGVTAPPGVRNTPDFPGGARRAAPGVQAPSDGGIRVRSPQGKVGTVTPEQWLRLQGLPGWTRL